MLNFYLLYLHSVQMMIMSYKKILNLIASVNIIDKNLTLSKLDIIICDRFGNMISGNLDWSMTLLFEFH